MRVPEAKIAEIAAAANIVEVVSDYVQLKRAGKDYRGLCPFHGDKDPSFYVSPQKGIFYCFGCATGGSVFNFLMKIENIPFAEAVRMVAQRYGVPFRWEAGTSRGSTDERQRLSRGLEAAHRYFRNALGENADARDYLLRRDIPDEWIARLELGFAPDAWEGLTAHLRREGISQSDAVAAGLVRPRESGGVYDYFRSRIMIPIRNLNAHLVAFGGRILGEGDPKYLNSPESSLFRKRDLLYGLDTAREGIKKEGYVVLVEGYFDQISLRIRGLENAVAPLGTGLGRDQVRLLKRFTSAVTVVFDADEAGLRAVKRSIPLFLAEGLEPRCVVLHEHKDPDEAVRAVGIDTFRSLLDNAVPMIDFLLDSLSSQYDLRTLQGRNAALQECLPVVREIADSKEADYLIERFSSRLRLSEKRLRQFLKGNREPKSKESSQRHGAAKSLFDFDAAERNVVRGMLLRPEYLDKVAKMGVVKYLEDPMLRLLADRMVSFHDRKMTLEPFAFLSSLEEESLTSLVAGWLHPRREENDLSGGEDGDVLLEDSLRSLVMRGLQKRKIEIQERMARCAPEDEEFSRLAEELRQTTMRLRHK
jgi:DNA primase